MIRRASLLDHKLETHSAKSLSMRFVVVSRLSDSLSSTDMERHGGLLLISLCSGSLIALCVLTFFIFHAINRGIHFPFYELERDTNMAYDNWVAFDFREVLQSPMACVTAVHS